MLKKLLVVALLALPICVSAQELKFATVNLQAIFQVMPETAAATVALQDKQKKYENELSKMAEELQTKYAAITEQKDSLPENILNARLAELQEIEQRTENFRRMAAEDIQAEQEKLMAPIQEKLMAAVKEVGTEGNYVYVLDETGVVFKGTMTEDITPKVKTKLGIQ
ncbi:MAG: OmpH family outer membrane protein [Bacteroidales bacterium]|nr:OmpH family outer membrane protein [Bacteroidales bacterium]